MKRYVVYDPATGAILRFGICPENMVGFQANPGEKVIEDTQQRDYSNLQVRNGQFVPQ